MSIVTLETLDYFIIASGSAMTFNKNADLRIKINFEEANFSFLVKFIFIDNDDEKQNLGLNSDAENGLIIINCTNFNNPLGTGTTQALELASVGGKKVSLHFWVYKLGKGSARRIDYCFYHEKVDE